MSWTDVEAPARYARFVTDHDRYAVANAHLVDHAGLAPGVSVLDVGAGLGDTAASALARCERLGPVVAVEPSPAMRAAAPPRPGVSWRADLPEGATFDRVLCGAAGWLLGPPDVAIASLASCLAARGALVLTIPNEVLGEVDASAPSGGDDPWFTAALGRLAPWSRPSASTTFDRWTRDLVDAALDAAGLRAEAWHFTTTWTSASYRDWLKIPAVGAGLLAGLEPAAWEGALDDAFALAPPSWREERWTGWTAWRP